MKSIWKKGIALALILVLVMTAFGCSSKDDGNAGNDGADGDAGAVGAGTDLGPIQIATKPMTEQFILSEILALLIEQETGYEVEITKGIGGGTGNIHPALLKGDFDLYPEYTATAWLNVLNHEEVPDEATLYTELCQEYEDQFNLKWVAEYGFNNTYAITVRNEVAAAHNLETYSDLAAASDQLIFGGNGDFIERVDGFIALSEVYGFDFQKVMDIDIGLKYVALANDEIDVTNSYTTDAQLSVADVKVLKDDLNFFTNYYAGTVVRMDTLEKYAGLEDALMLMDGILSDGEMAALNYEVEVNQRDEKDVAAEFLQGKGLLK